MNDRRKITAELVQEAGRLFAQGQALQAVAADLGITPYIAGLLQENVHTTWASTPPPPQGRGLSMRQTPIDEATLRQVQRMLAVHWLQPCEIARQAGVDEASVRHIKAGKYLVRNSKSIIAPHEQLLSQPRRCRECGGLIYITPCRLCATRKKILLVNVQICCLAVACAVFFALIRIIPAWARQTHIDLKRLARPRRRGRKHSKLVRFLKKLSGNRRKKKTMNDLLPILAAEAAAFLSAADKREYLIVRSEKLFDEIIAPVDLPGPDAIVDPLLRASIRPLLGRVYDEVIKKLEEPANAA